MLCPVAETNAHRFVALNAEAAAIYKTLGAEFKNFDMISESPTTAATAFPEERIFYVKPGKSPVGPARAGDRNAPRCRTRLTPDNTVSYRCLGHSAGPHALYVDLARRRCGFFRPLVGRQSPVLKILAQC
jgi:hypothetical protein